MKNFTGFILDLYKTGCTHEHWTRLPDWKGQRFDQCATCYARRVWT